MQLLILRFNTNSREKELFIPYPGIHLNDNGNLLAPIRGIDSYLKAARERFGYRHEKEKCRE